MQSIFFAVNNNSMTGIVASVESGDIIDFSTNQIGRFSFAFVTPLGANKNDSRHHTPPNGIYKFERLFADFRLHEALYRIYERVPELIFRQLFGISR